MIANDPDLVNYFYRQRVIQHLQLYREKLAKCYYNVDKHWCERHIMYLENELKLIQNDVKTV